MSINSPIIKVLLCLLGALRCLAEPITISVGGYTPSLSSGNGWRPVKDSPKYFTRAHWGTSAPKIFSSDPSTSNKVEVFAPAPPSILGSFTDFGHATVKAREPANIKKKSPIELLHFPVPRTKYSSGLIPPPVRATEMTGFKTQNSPYQQNEGQAYYFEASLAPPPRTFSNPSSSNYLPSNSYYMDFHNHNSGNMYSGSRKPSSSNNYDFYMPSQSSSQIYSPPRHSSHDNSFRGGFRHDHYYYYSPDYYSTRAKPTSDSSHYRTQYGEEVTMTTRRPSVEKNPGVDVYEQLSHLGRPFQNPEISEYSSQRPVNYLTTSVNGLIQSTQDTSSSKDKSRYESVYRSPSYDSYSNIHSDSTVTRQPSAQVFPLPVTTVDVPSPDDDDFSSNTDVKPKPSHYYSDTSTENGFLPLRPSPEVKTYSPFIEEQPSHFIPTPATRVEPFIDEPTPNEVATSPPEDSNEIRKPLYRTRFPQPKPTDLPAEDLSTIEVDTPKPKPTRNKNKKNNIENKYNEYDNLQSEQQPRKPYVSKYRRRRPQKQQDTAKTEQTTEVVQKLEEVVQKLEEVFPTAFTEYPTGKDNELPTVLPSQIPHRRRKKPHHKHRLSSNRYRPSEEQSVALTTTTPTPTTIQAETESPDYSTEYTEFSNVAPSKSPDIKERHNIPDDTNTIFPTQTPDDITTTELVTTPFVKSTTSTTTTAEPTTTARARLRSKYGNHTRPRFSVKEYRERLKTTTTQSPVDEPVVTRESLKTIKRIRGSSQHKNQNEDSKPEETEVTTKKYKSRYSGGRYPYRTTSTTASPVPTDTTTTTERVNGFRPLPRHRPGTGKYYSRYRTSTETPTESQDLSTTAASLPAKPKGVFSAKRRPYPLRTRYSTSTKSNDNEAVEETKISDTNEVASDHVITDKADTADTTTMTSSEEHNWNYPSSLQPETTITDPSASSVISQKVADLTSSPSNAYDSSGFFKGVSPSSRRTVSQITLATDDPILPIEAFFQSWSSQKEAKETR